MKHVTALADRLSGPLLAALGLINALFFATFVAVLALAMGRAHAADPCGGDNILDTLEESDPARYRDIRAEARDVPYGDSLLFRIEKDGVEPSWLFGTMHVTDPRILDMPEEAKNAFESARTLAIESIEILDPAKAQASLFAKPDLTMFTDGTTLSDYLSEEESEALKEGLSKRGMQLALVERMKPWLLSGMVALPACEFERKQEGQLFLDLKLAHEAEADGKNLVGLETITEQFEAIASLPMEFHVKALVETLALGDRIDDVMQTMTDLYVEGSTGAIWPMLRYVSDEAGSGEDMEKGYAAFEEALVDVRNRTMLERAVPLVEDGGTFIAVGALHLPGEDGLAALFDGAGYTVTPVYE